MVSEVRRGAFTSNLLGEYIVIEAIWRSHSRYLSRISVVNKTRLLERLHSCFVYDVNALIGREERLAGSNHYKVAWQLILMQIALLNYTKHDSLEYA